MLYIRPWYSTVHCTSLYWTLYKVLAVLYTTTAHLESPNTEPAILLYRVQGTVQQLAVLYSVQSTYCTALYSVPGNTEPAILLALVLTESSNCRISPSDSAGGDTALYTVHCTLDHFITDNNTTISWSHKTVGSLDEYFQLLIKKNSEKCREGLEVLPPNFANPHYNGKKEVLNHANMGVQTSAKVW